MIRGAVWGGIFGLFAALVMGHQLAFIAGEPATRGVKGTPGTTHVNDQFRWRVATPLLAGTGVTVGLLVGLVRDRLSHYPNEP